MRIAIGQSRGSRAIKPGDFFVGVIDLFSILLPGTLLAASLAILIPTPPPLQNLLAVGGARWVAFALAAYALGHFAFLLSARLDPHYDRFRDRKWPDFKAAGSPFEEATKLRDAQIARPKGPEDHRINTFKWAKTVLMLRAPAALADVNRYEADSKFFRSLVVVLPAVGLIAGLKEMWLVLPVALVLARVSFSIYAEQRYKSTQWAYHYVIVLGRLGELDKARAPDPGATAAARQALGRGAVDPPDDQPI